MERSYLDPKEPKALAYAQKKYLETFLEDGRLPICEATIRPFATARRA